MDLDELKKIAEKKMGMSWDQILEQANKDTAKQKNLRILSLKLIINRPYLQKKCLKRA